MITFDPSEQREGTTGRKEENGLQGFHCILNKIQQDYSLNPQVISFIVLSLPVSIIPKIENYDNFHFSKLSHNRQARTFLHE